MAADLLAHGRRHLRREALQLHDGIRGRTEDERVHPVLDHQLRELVHPLPDAALQEAAASADRAPDVVDARDLCGLATGSHRASLAALQAGVADATSLDCVTHALLARHRPAALAGTRILATTAPSPTLPWVTAAATDAETMQALRQALAETVGDKSLRWAFEALLVDGVVATSMADYEVLLDYAQTAARLGYRELA